MADHCLLYYITDRKAFAADESTRRCRLLEKIAEAARAGVDYIQLREKDLSTRELESLTRDAVAILTNLRTESPTLRTKLLVNSRTDIALSAGADGVHLRSDDLSPETARLVWKRHHVGTAAPGWETPLIGVSCHTPYQVRQAEQQSATFSVFAPVFEKKEAPDAPPAGLTKLREACQSSIPVLALGGITVANAHSCLEAGAAGIAAIRLFQENDIAELAEKLRR